MDKLSIIIPVYNEARTLKELLRRVASQPLSLKKEILIVESASTDGSTQIVKDFLRDFPASQDMELKAIFQQTPRGKGFAMREGLERATGDIVLIQDGDLEYEVADYPRLLEPILDGTTDFVLGSRHLKPNDWRIRTFQNQPFRAWFMNIGGVFFHAFFNLLYGTRLTDPTTMFKVFKRSCIRGLVFKSNRFDFDYELLGKLIRAGYTPLEVPVAYDSRGFHEGKKIRIFRDPFTWVAAIIRFRFEPLHSKNTLVTQPQKGLA